MKKEIKRKIIFEKHYDGIITGIRFKDLPKDLLPDDIIDIRKEEGYYDSDSSCDDASYLYVYREELETDEEFNKRKKYLEERFAESEKLRYEQYLKLKKEFEK